MPLRYRKVELLTLNKALLGRQPNLGDVCFTFLNFLFPIFFISHNFLYFSYYILFYFILFYFILFIVILFGMCLFLNRRLS